LKCTSKRLARKLPGLVMDLTEARAAALARYRAKRASRHHGTAKVRALAQQMDEGRPGAPSRVPRPARRQAGERDRA